MNYVTGCTIRQLREHNNLTQRQLADLLCVSDKTISKWETGRGLPDISLLSPLAEALHISVAELLAGEAVENHNRASNMQRCVFYVCPVCGNVILASGKGSYSCCGISLPALEPEDPSPDHGIRAEIIDNEYFVSLDHAMTKEHYISFFAYVTSDRAELVKLYPEQDAVCRFSRRGHGMLYAFCNRHGLFRVRI